MLIRAFVRTPTVSFFPHSKIQEKQQQQQDTKTKLNYSTTTRRGGEGGGEGACWREKQVMCR